MFSLTPKLRLLAPPPHLSLYKSLITLLPPSLLDEYHELYELQRKRMEEQLSHMTYEQDLWKQAAYDLSWRVASEFNLLSFQTLQLNERTWCKLAGHFIIILSSKDTKQVCVCASEEGHKLQPEIILIYVGVRSTRSRSGVEGKNESFPYQSL